MNLPAKQNSLFYSDKPFLARVESALFSLAEQVTPEGTKVKSVIHQWAHAVAYGTDLFGHTEDNEKAREVVINSLRTFELFLDQKTFRAELMSNLALKSEFPTKFSFIDLFAGVGGMRLGFQQNGGMCVFSSEYDKFAQKTYSDNYGEIPFGDITAIDPQDVPAHDVLLAGFPCQPFSQAGLKQGIEDTRGTLFHNIAEILKAKRPKMALLENVKGLISHEKGRTLQIILRTLTRIGYSCNISKELIETGSAKEIQKEAKKMILKSTDFGVPQNRQRIYIVLWLDGLIDNFKYPTPSGVATRVGDILEVNPDEKYTISDRLWAGHQRRKKQNKLDGKGFGYGLVSPDSTYTNTISARYYKDGSEILIAQEGKNPRKLSPREAARLQGFPEKFSPASSNTQAYKQFGNSVSVPVITALGAAFVGALS